MHVLPVGGLFVAAVFKALDTARYLHKPVCTPLLTLRMHSDVSCVVLPSEENVEGTDCSLRCGAPVGLSMWVPELLSGSTDVEVSSSIRFYCCTFGNDSVCRIDLLSI